MTGKTLAELHQDSARLKLKLDDAARNKYARDEGYREGFQTGKLLGQIQMLQQFLSESTPTRDELLKYNIEQLTALFNDLDQRFRSRS